MKRYWFRAMSGRVWHMADMLTTRESRWVLTECGRLFMPEFTRDWVEVEPERVCKECKRKGEGKA